MKNAMLALVSFAMLFLAVSCSVAQSAKNKTQGEISRKTNKKIEEVFRGNPNEEKPASDNGQVTAEKPPQKAQRKKSEFVPGEQIIFVDSQKVEQLGEFPSKWDLERGTVEMMKFEDRDVIGFTSGATIFPLMDEKSYLPDEFTIEFDCYFHDYGNEGYYLNFDSRECNFRVHSDGIKTSELYRAEVESRRGWKHVEVSFNKRSLKIYFEGERLVNIPNVKVKPTNVKFKALSHGARLGKYAMVKNIRIAEGGVPLYDRLVTDGKFVTRNIHFEYNQATLKSESWAVVGQVAYMLEKHPEVKLRIDGHTDSDGTAAYNLELSQRRADAVKNALVQEGVDSGRLTTMGYGETMPIESNETETGKAMNRRVEFLLIEN